MPLIASLLELYSFVVLAAVVISWLQLDPKHPVASIVYRLTEPILGPLRQVLPSMAGLDFSPMVLLFLLQALTRFF
jgi:YggT family protein